MKSLSVKLGVVLIGLVIFGYAEVWGADWKLYEETDLRECFYDAENMIRSSRDVVEVWTKLEYTGRGVADMAKRFGKHYKNLSYLLELWDFNCAEKKDRLLSITAYTEEGNILYTDQVESRLPPWKIISRGSTEESLYKEVCR